MNDHAQCIPASRFASGGSHTHDGEPGYFQHLPIRRTVTYDVPSDALIRALGITEVGDVSMTFDPADNSLHVAIVTA